MRPDCSGRQDCKIVSQSEPQQRIHTGDPMQKSDRFAEEKGTELGCAGPYYKWAGPGNG